MGKEKEKKVTGLWIPMRNTDVALCVSRVFINQAQVRWSSRNEVTVTLIRLNFDYFKKQLNSGTATLLVISDILPKLSQKQQKPISWKF